MGKFRYHFCVHIYCSGIGGIGLSAYASLERALGHTVSGSDRSRTALTEDLEKQGIQVVTDQSGKALPEKCDLFVYSEAIPADAPERKAAKKKGIPQKSYPEALGEMSKGHRVIAVCGTHGKSSTTAMAARLLIEKGSDPTVVIGTKIKELDGRNWRKGKSDLFLLEACEYRKSFHFYDANIILLTNVDGDHFDYYGSVEEYEQSFLDFILRLPDDGVLITHMQDPRCRALAEKAGKKVIDADTFPLITLGTPGLHMQKNAQLALALGEVLQFNAKECEKAVSGYSGSWRRMEEKGFFKGAVVIDDYAHHPVEIAATLAGLRQKYPKKRFVTVFQPHTHDRTLRLYEDFTKSFGDTNLLILSDVYEARKDIETDKVDVKKFATGIAEKSRTDVIVGGSLQKIEKALHQIVQAYDIVVCMGAGDVTNLTEALTRK